MFRQTLALAASLADSPDMQNAIARLMRPEDMLETFAGLTHNGISQSVEDLAAKFQVSQSLG